MVGIVCFWDRIATPYLKKYEDLLLEIGEPYEVIFWNRSECIVEDDAIYIYINIKCFGSKIKKIKKFIKWRKEVLHILENKRYDKLVILSTVPGVLLYTYLVKKYKSNYLFDIRDYTLEANPIFGWIVTNLVENSAFTTISSKGFYEWLKPSDRIVPNHNITFYKPNMEHRKFFCRERINFTFVGNVRLDLQTKMVLYLLKNSQRYISSFIGRIVPGCDIIEFCQIENIQNVHFQGHFNLEDKPKIYEDVDLINAIYANATCGKIGYGDSTPLPNRIYDCVCFKVPIVCCKGIYLEKIINKFNLGFAIDAYADNIESEFDKYINSFDERKFLAGCNEFMEEVHCEEQHFIKLAKDYLKS